MLSESEYLDIVERYERLSMGDRTVSRIEIMVDFAKLLADWREWERENKRLEREHELYVRVVNETVAENERLRTAGLRLAAQSSVEAVELEQLRKQLGEP